MNMKLPTTKNIQGVYIIRALIFYINIPLRSLIQMIFNIYSPTPLISIYCYLFLGISTIHFKPHSSYQRHLRHTSASKLIKVQPLTLQKGAFFQLLWMWPKQRNWFSLIYLDFFVISFGILSFRMSTHPFYHMHPIYFQLATMVSSKNPTC